MFEMTWKKMKRYHYNILMARKHQPDIERLTRRIVFMLPPSLFAEFEKRCKEQYRTVSEELRDLVAKSVLDKKQKEPGPPAKQAPARN
jgi:hypothetical protein